MNNYKLSYGKMAFYSRPFDNIEFCFSRACAALVILILRELLHLFMTNNGIYTARSHKVGLGKTPHRFNLTRCRYSSLEKFEDAFDTTLYLMQSKPSDAAYSAIFRSFKNAERKQLVTPFLACFWADRPR